MTRAALAIGVNQAGDFPALNNAVRSATRMAEWAKAQGLDCTLITDTAGPVTVQRICEAVGTIMRDGTCEQLIIYFSGHGVNIGTREYWLLTNAPTWPHEAVNVQGTVDNAHFSAIPHVVLISDACRTAAVGLQAQNITGTSIFPNTLTAPLSQAVDQFFACSLGRPALEVQAGGADPVKFSDVYTEVLLGALNGQRAAALEWEDAPAPTGYVRPRKLKAFLAAEVPKKVESFDLPLRVYQVPDAQIESADKAWLSRLPRAAIPLAAAAGEALPSPMLTPAELCNELLPAAVGSPEAEFLVTLERLRVGRRPGMQEVLDEVTRLVPPFGPDSLPSRCGFKVRGANVAEAMAADADTQVRAPELVEVMNLQRPGTCVLLILADGRAALLPALAGYVCALSFNQDGDLLDVAWERSAGPGPTASDVRRQRQVRAVAAVASSWGRLHLEPYARGPRSATFLAETAARNSDPALAVYVAYADGGPNWKEHVLAPLSESMRQLLGASLFDLAMRAGQLREPHAQPVPPLLPPFPMRAAGWASISALAPDLVGTLQDLRGSVTSSPWTLFDARAVGVLRRFISNGGRS